MTTHTYSSVIAHTSDATFRAWGSELSAALATIGLIQTADTGQINWSTVTRPGSSASAGYEIWKLPGSDPLYFKVEYGTAGTVTSPEMWCTVGEGSNGAGTLTGQTSTRVTLGNTSAIISTSTPYTSYLCATQGFFGMSIKTGGSGSSSSKAIFNFYCAKTVDGTGAYTSLGYFVVFGQTGPTASSRHQSVRRAAPAATYTLVTNSMWFAPGGPATSVDTSGNFQFYTVWSVTPNVQPIVGLCGYIVADVPILNTFQVAMVASTPHTYLTLGNNLGGTEAAAGTSNSVYSLAMLWE